MIERIRQLWSEASWVLVEVIGSDFEIEQALIRLQAALDNLEAVDDPSDEQIETIFTALSILQGNLFDSLLRVPTQHHPLLENLTDRIEIFLFHHRL